MLSLETLLWKWLFGFLGVGVLLGVALWVVWRLVAGGDRPQLVYPARLREFGDRLRSTTVLNRSRVGGHLHWLRDGRWFYLYSKSFGNAVWSVVAARIPAGSLPRFQVRTRTAGIPVPAPPVLCTRTTGLPEFDKRYEVRFPAGSPEALPPIDEAWYQVLLIGNLCDPPRLVLEVQDQQIRLFLPGVLVQRPEREATLEQACKLIETVLFKYASLLPETAGVQVDVLAEASPGEATCPVCSEGITAARVLCAKCATPHHPECWSYAGTCAVYGCGSSEAREGA